ncbi:MAG: VWA domain-containing protein [Deltaproteobacteria bacterium]|nr:VWA domain-containing protein [Deltaproteobacteria bacterium]
MKKMSVWGLWSLGLFCISGCGEMAGDLGATPGGVQDMGTARELIQNGQVPPPEAFSVEGMFSEHDLPLEGAPCEETLCLRGALGVAPGLDGQPRAWFQVGLSSGVDPGAFERPSLAIVAAVDVSGSMGWNYSDDDSAYPTPGAISRRLLKALAAELGPADQLAIVTYGSSVQTVLPLTRGDRAGEIRAAIDGLDTGGSTNMEAGMERAYELARQALDSECGQVRVMLFTDAQPNVGASQVSYFEELAHEGAEAGVGLTVFGVGLGLRQELMEAMVHMRGGNAFSLFDYQDVVELMEDDWPFLACPIAYDLSVLLTLPEGFRISGSYGFPGQHDEREAGMQVATVFLSRRKGALLLELSPEQGRDLTGLHVQARLSYEALDGRTGTESLSSSYAGQALDARGQYFEQPVVAKTVALAILVSHMALAAEAYTDDGDRAIRIMRAAAARIEADAESIGDPALAPEVELARRLLELMEQGAPQGDLYGQR